MGSAVPHVTKDGLQGIQEPLRDLYPDQGLLLAQKTDSIGIDSWLSVWSNGILVENVDENGREVNKFFPIESLHYCAAVRYVVIPASAAANDEENLKSGDGEPHDPNRRMHQRESGSQAKIKFLPLDSPFSRNSNITLHPPLFACILRRTTGIKVLECHAFICKRDQAANALVRCCFHAYADSMHAKQMEQDVFESQSNYGTHTLQPAKQNGSKMEMTRRFSRSISDLDSVENKIEAWRQRSTEALNLEDIQVIHSNGCEAQDGDGDESLTFSRRASHPLDDDHDDDDNYKVWSGGSGIMERSLMMPQASASTPHLHRLHPMPIPFLRPGHDGRATLRSIRTTVSSAHHPHFRPPSVSSRSMINLMGPPHPHHHMPHHQQFPPPHMLPPLQTLQPLPPFLPVPSTLTKKELKSLKSSLKKLKKKNKGALAPEFLIAGPPHPPPFLRHHPPMPFVMPPPRGHPPPGHPLHHLHPVHADEPIYVPAMRPLTPLSANPHYGPPNGYHFHPEHPLPHSHPFAGLPPPPPLAMRRDVSRNGHPDPGHRVSPSSRRNSHSNSRKPDSNSEAEPSDSSPFNTGIYRKKANLNERAFSYSIRQESRSRSNSLANVNYSPSQEPGSSGLITNEEAEFPSTNGRSNGQVYNRDAGIIAQSLESLHLNGNGAKINNHNRHINGKSSMSSQSSLQSNSGMNGKTASIKRGSGPSHLNHHVNGGGGSKPVPMPTIHSNGRNNHNH